MTQQTHFDYDFIVIGSGFGGSVSALRLAQKGYKTAIIEKGKRWQNKDFPKTNWNIKKYLWFPQIGCYGYQMMTQLRHVMILHGSGVGGGSLVYANQLLVPPDDVFDNPGWGITDCKKNLMPHYQTARKMLGANPSPSIGAADRCLREVGIQMRGKDTFHKNDVSIFFGTPKETVPDPYFDGQGPDRVGCDFCGACMVGCPSGAKNTLDKNYLYLAEKLGVDIIPETQVIGVTPGKEGYEIFTRKTPGIIKSRRTYKTRGAVFSGGVMGTVKLLMKCRHQGLLPKLSDQLGHQVRTNSEVLLGVKSRDKKTDWNDQIAITSGIYPDDTTHIEMVRYNKGSDAMLALLNLLTGGGGKVPRFLRYMGNIVRHPVDFIKLLWPLGKASSTTVLLVMQTDDNFLTLDYKPRWWRFGRYSMNSVIPEGNKGMKAYIPIANEVAKKLAKKMDGIPLSYIAESIFNSGSTAHILGGCRMGDSPANGVVAKNGELFGYPNLFVADGSVVPVNLGVNPSLTITALSEYIMSQMPEKNLAKDASTPL